MTITHYSFPNAQGFVTVTIPAGAVPEGSTIVVINNASGATVTTVVGSAAISLQIQAQVGDEITVLVRQPDGTEYRINQAAYKKSELRIRQKLEPCSDDREHKIGRTQTSLPFSTPRLITLKKTIS